MDQWTLGKDPIHTDHPAGSDIRYETIFEDLQSEIDKLSLPSAAATGIDWQKVADLAAAILSEHSKDILVVSYFALAKTHLSQIEGFYQGVRVYSDLLENFWDTLFPAKKRMRGRLGALEWWIEKSETALQINNISVTNAQQSSLEESLDRLDQLIEQCFPEPPSLRPLRSALEPIFQTVKSEPAAIIQKAAETTSPVTTSESNIEQQSIAAQKDRQTSTPSTRPAANNTSLEKPSGSTVQDGMEILRRAVSNMEKINPADPQVYRLRRLSLWASIEDAPPATQLQTLILPPDPQFVSILHTLNQKGDWLNLLSAAELQLTQNIFWLDLNRFAAESLDNSGPLYRFAYEAVCQETSHLIQRMPELPTLRFSDGSPLADQQTQDWLASISTGSASALAYPISAGEADTSVQNRIQEVFQNAQQLVKEKKLIEAVSLIQQELEICTSAKHRLHWRLALSQILVVGRKADMAQPHLDKILEDIEQYSIEKWDTELALQCFKVIWSGFKAMSGKDSRQMADQILHRIARLHPAEALRLE